MSEKVASPFLLYQIALIENTAREELNPIAKAFAMQRLADEFGYTHEEIGFYWE